MTTTIQNILTRIEKLKAALNEKNERLEQREAELVEKSERLEALEELVRSQGATVAQLQTQLKQASAQRTEAFSLASYVETMTKSQRQIFELREEIRELKSGTKSARTLRPVERHTDKAIEATDEILQVAEGAGIVADEAEVGDLTPVIIEQQQQIQALEAQLAEARDAPPITTPMMLSAESVAAAQALGQRLGIANRAPSAQNISGLADFMRACTERVESLSSSTTMETNEIDQVLLVMQEQLDEAERRAASSADEATELRRRVAELEAELAERDAVILEQLEQLTSEG